MGDFHHDAEALRVVGMLNGHAEQSISAFFGDDAALAGFEYGGIETIEATHEVGMADHGLPNPVVVLVADQTSIDLGQLRNGV